MNTDQQGSVRWSPLRAALFSLSLVAAAGLCGIALWAMISPTEASAGGDAGRAVARQGWVAFGDGMDLARAEDKPLLVNFNATWCGYCQKMDRETWSHPAVVERMGDVVAVRVDIDDERRLNGFSGTELAQTYRVNGTPTQMLIDPSGRVLSRAGGFQTSQQLLLWLESGLEAQNARGALPAAGS